MEHTASIGAGAPAAHASAPAAAPHGAHGAAAHPPSPASPGDASSTLVSLSDAGRARADDDTPDMADAARVAAHVALAVLGEPDGLVADVAQAAAGYATQAGLDLAGRIDEIA
ncbi:hypothetical protein [Rhizobacter sp. SG703]|uniref:hypothetical protein n=1 Tax=Rhizobacter sp. SG703 TaxID=2587140 RepID=UPI00144706AC|nr:hypothetical protein [Rhizobacter sp. SG703]NKI95254.1 hypothetical protein [Rhizobacter sp. SG703]